MKWHIRHLWAALIVAALLLLVATIAIGIRAGAVPNGTPGTSSSSNQAK